VLFSSNECGQSLVESALVIVMFSLIFFGMLQVVLKLHGEWVQQWAAYAGARSRVVGFNDAIVQKAWFIANIMNSGEMLAPQTGLSAVSQVGVESTAIPIFIQTEGTVYELAPQLNYEAWDNRDLYSLGPATPFEQYTAQGKQNYQLTIAQLIPMLGSSFGQTNLMLQSQVTLENHAPFYLEIN